MGSTNHGNQNISWTFHEELTALDFNKRSVDITPRGIYSGGYLTRVSNTEVTLSPFSLEIGDDDIQIDCRSSQNAILNNTTLDSGNIASATSYLVFRWAYGYGQPDNYVEIRAIASVSVAQANDIIIGKCVFVGGVLQETFDYTDRTFLNVQDTFLKVIPNEAGGEYVWVRAGRVHTSTGCAAIPEQRVGPFSVPTAPNARIDLVYVDTDGTIKIHSGTAAVSPSVPSYGGKLVLAQVRINSEGVISNITDVRSFISGQNIVGGVLRNLKRGVVDISIINKSYGKTTVDISDLGLTSTNYTPQLTSKTTDGGNPPEGTGPYYVPFYRNKTATSFQVWVADLMNNPWTVTVSVEYTIIG